MTLGNKPNYSVSVPATSGALTVTARPATVRANDKSKTYGEDNPTLDATVTGEVTAADAINYRMGTLAGGDPVNYTLSTTATKFSIVTGSPYTITVTLGDNPNYSVTVTHYRQ